MEPPKTPATPPSNLSHFFFSGQNSFWAKSGDGWYPRRWLLLTLGGKYPGAGCRSTRGSSREILATYVGKKRGTSTTKITNIWFSSLLGGNGLLAATAGQHTENRLSEDRVTGGSRESAPFPVTVTGPPSVTVLRPT